MNQVRQRLGAGEMPAAANHRGPVAAGRRSAIADFLVFVTDAFGFTCLFPLTRQWLARQIAARSMGHVNVVVGGMGPGPSANGLLNGHPFGDAASPGGRPHSGSSAQ